MSITGVDRVTFGVEDIVACRSFFLDFGLVFGGGMNMSRCGHETQLGPGKHPISSAFFWYFKSPAGALMEYYADEDVLTENWTPRDMRCSTPNAFRRLRSRPAR